MALQYSRFGREIRVTREALADFGRRLAESDGPLACGNATPTATTPRPSDARRAREVEAAKENLRKEGVL